MVWVTEGHSRLTLEAFTFSPKSSFCPPRAATLKDSKCPMCDSTEEYRRVLPHRTEKNP